MAPESARASSTVGSGVERVRTHAPVHKECWGEHEFRSAKKRDASEGAKDWEIGRSGRSSPQVSAIEVTGPALLFRLAVLHAVDVGSFTQGVVLLTFLSPLSFRELI